MIYEYKHQNSPAGYIITGEKREYFLYEDGKIWQLDGIVNPGEELDFEFEPEGSDYFYVGEIVSSSDEAPLKQAFLKIEEIEKTA